MFVKGAWSLRQDFLEIDFLIVLIERSNSYQKLFTKLKNIALSLKYCWSKFNLSALLSNCITCAIFNRMP